MSVSNRLTFVSSIIHLFIYSFQLQLCDIADRVNLGLIPSSEEGWPIACRLLKRTTGGILHIHHNVTSPLTNTAAVPANNCAILSVSRKAADREVWQAWADDTANRVACLLKDITGAQWMTSIRHIEPVKSYAPHVHHIVLDLECRPRERQSSVCRFSQEKETDSSRT